MPGEDHRESLLRRPHGHKSVTATFWHQTCAAAHTSNPSASQSNQVTLSPTHAVRWTLVLSVQLSEAHQHGTQTGRIFYISA